MGCLVLVSCCVRSVFAGELAAVGGGGRDHRQRRRRAAQRAARAARQSGYKTLDHGPEARRMVHLGQMRDLVRDHIVDQRRLEMDQPPVQPDPGAALQLPQRVPRSTAAGAEPAGRGGGSTPPRARGTRPAPARAARAPGPAADRPDGQQELLAVHRAGPASAPRGADARRSTSARPNKRQARARPSPPAAAPAAPARARRRSSSQRPWLCTKRSTSPSGVRRGTDTRAPR
jgi:hypothetical protein